MKVLHLLLAHVGLWFHSWAMREAGGDHPDIPRILERQTHYRDQLKRLGVEHRF